MFSPRIRGPHDLKGIFHTEREENAYADCIWLCTAGVCDLVYHGLGTAKRVTKRLQRPHSSRVVAPAQGVRQGSCANNKHERWD